MYAHLQQTGFDFLETGRELAVETETSLRVNHFQNLENNWASPIRWCPIVPRMKVLTSGSFVPRVIPLKWRSPTDCFFVSLR
jgi:hypothetical protein